MNDMRPTGRALTGWAFAALTAFSLAACDNGGTDASGPPPSHQPEADVSARAVPASTDEASSIGNGSNMTGAVSGLMGDVRGFRVRTTATATILELPSDTLFAFDQGELTPQAVQTLPEVAQRIRDGGDGVIVISGHTDALGADDYNLSLSKRRAEAVRDWLVKQQGLSASRFQIEAVGKARPIAPDAHPDGTDNPEGRQLNRRVEVSIPRP